MPRISLTTLRTCLGLLLAGSSAFAAQKTFLAGADVSALPVHERLGTVYSARGNKGDALVLLRAEGLNCFRLRLFVHPDGQGIVTNDLPYTLELARRIRASGAAFLLDLHYSDTWADPAKQHKPAAWAKLPFESLCERVRDYTRETLQRFRREGLMPDYVQIGNEITNGMLWPEGRVEFSAPDEAAWKRLAALLLAGFEGLEQACDGAKKPQTILHIESTGNRERTLWWLNNARLHKLPFELIGISYYPDWHGSIGDLSATLAWIAAETGKPVLVAETAYPHKPDAHFADKPGMTWPMTPEGQRAFLSEVVDAVRKVPEGRGAGVLYWYPEAVPAWGIHTWVGGSCALFDEQGRMLPGASFAK